MNLYDHRNEVLAFPFPRFPNSSGSLGILDEAFEGLATAKANAEKNLQNARALFESHLQSVFTQRGKGWVETTLESRCEQILDSMATFRLRKNRLSQKRDSRRYSVPIFSKW